MRATFNTFSSALLPRLQKLTNTQNATLAQISSGQRITVASDDPAAMDRVLDLQGEKGRQQQFWDNSNRAMSLSQSSFSVLDQLNKVGTRAGELAISGASATAPASDRVSYGVEVNQLIETAVATANAKEQGNYLLSGTATHTAPFAITRDVAGSITGVTYAGAADDGAPIRISETETISPTSTAAENGQVADFLNNLVALRDALTTGSASAVVATHPGLHASEDALLAGLSRAGGVQYRLQASTSTANTRFLALNNSISQVSDVDVAEASIQLTRTQTAYQAAIQSAAKVISTSLLDYIR